MPLHDRIPREPGTPRVLGFPGAFDVDPQRALSADGVILSFRPARGEPWIGVFELGDWGSPPAAPRQVIGWPDELSVCVVHGGLGCIVRTDDPALNADIDCFPICDVLTVPDHRLVVFADFSSLVAYGPEGIAWRTKQLAWDDVEIVAAEGDTLRVRGYDPTARSSFPIFSVDLRTGESPDRPYWDGVDRGA